MDFYHHIYEITKQIPAIAGVKHLVNIKEFILTRCLPSACKINTMILFGGLFFGIICLKFLFEK